MKEVEILISVKDKKEDVLKKLNHLNFVGLKEVVDVYFYDLKRPELSPDENGRLRQCLRLRKKCGKCYLTHKVDHFNGDAWSHSDEHEVEISDFESGMEILKNLGLEVLVKIENEKYTFLTDKYEIVFENVKNLGLFLEVERLSVYDNESIVDIKREIRDFIQDLNIKTGEELNAGKPELMLKNLKNLSEARE